MAPRSFDLRDDLPMDDWQRVRSAQSLGDDTLVGGAGADDLSLRPGQIGAPQQSELRGVGAASSLFGRAADIVEGLTRTAPLQVEPAPMASAKPPPRRTYSKRDAALDLGAQYVLERIAIGEQPDRPVSYDVTYGYGAFVPPGSKKLTDMTFEEVAALQDEMLRRQAGNRGRKSRPVGKYQFMPATLERLRTKLGLKTTDVFTPGVQDMMARELLHERGYADFLSGKIDAAAFQESLANEWASVAQPKTGKSRYGQPVGTTTQQMQSALSQARIEAQRRISEAGVDPYARRWR